jgi:GTPase
MIYWTQRTRRLVLNVLVAVSCCGLGRYESARAFTARSPALTRAVCSRNSVGRPWLPAALPATEDHDEETDDVYYYAPNQEQQQQPLNTTVARNGSLNQYSFFDEAIISVRAGSGGQGASTYQKLTGGGNGRPDGGHGGVGGNVILQVDPALNTLAGLSSSSSSLQYFRAENGGAGRRQFKNGRAGAHVVVRVPPGTMIDEQVGVDDDNVPIWQPLAKLMVAEPESDEFNDNDDSTPSLIVARGGPGGEGTGIVKSRGVKRIRQAAGRGQERVLKLTLSLVADVAIVGVPNAGKSTFIAAVTRATPKIANVCHCRCCQ